MDIPLNILHNYLGLPILLGISIDSLLRYRKTNNQTVLYLGLGSFFAAIATAAFGVPALLTDNSYLISVGTLGGDIALSISLFWFWQISFRAIFTNRRTIAAATTIVAGLSLAVIIEAIFRNLTPPYGSYLIHDAAGRLALEYHETLFYIVANGLNSVALLLVGVYFIRQAKHAPGKGQRIRIRSLATGFSTGGLAFLITPIFPTDVQPLVNLTLFMIGFVIIAIGTAIGMLTTRSETPR